MPSYKKIWLTTFAAFLIIDLIWLGIIAQPIYDHFIGDFLAESPNWPAAIVFYALFVTGLIYFAVQPALEYKSTDMAIQHGALFGFFTYMTYELTNYAVIEGWPLGIVFIDIVWGIALGTLVAYSTVRYLLKSPKLHLELYN